MEKKLFQIIVLSMVFWIMTDILEGIAFEGIMYRILFSIGWGIIASYIMRLISFFTLPENILVIVVISILTGMIVLSIFNFILPGVDFMQTTIPEYQTSVISFSGIELGMVGNIILGGIILGVMSGLLIRLSEDS